MLKKLCATILATMVGVSAFACWFTQENFESNYLAGINYFKPHYVNNGSAVNNSIETAQYINGENGSFYSVSLPLTVWFKVSPRTLSVNGTPQKYYLRVSKLYYKILPGNQNSATAKWRLAKTIDLTGSSWNMDYNSPVKLFGNNNITKAMIERNGDTISAGDGIVLAWYLTDSCPDSIANAELITPGSTDPQIFPSVTEGYSVRYAGSDYKPAYVARVVYNGKNIINIGR